MQPEGEVQKTPSVVQVRIRKKVLIIAGIVIVVIVLGVLIWRLQLAQRAYAAYNSGTISIKVKEGDKFVLEGAKLELEGKTYTTDAAGKAVLAKVVAGNRSVHITKDGYAPVDQPITVRRGDNDLVIVSLTKIPDKVYAISGFTQDYVSGLNLVDTQVTLNGTSKATNPNGEFSFEGLKVGDYQLTLSKAGYLTKEMPITITDADVSRVKASLTPVGEAIFTSNRDGKRALYVSAYDGTNQRQFVSPQNGGEDYSPLISPDGKYVLFWSTRDQQKNAYGSILARLYMATRDGKNVKKVSDDFDHQNVAWSATSNYFYFRAYTTTEENVIAQRIYDIAKGKTFDMGDDSASSIVFSNDGKTVLYVTSKYEEEQPQQYTNYLTVLTLASGERKTLLKKNGNSFTTIAFTNDDKAVTYEFTEQSTRKRFEVTISSAVEREINVPTDTARSYIVSPDKKSQIFTEERDGKTDLFLVDMAGKNEKRLTSLGVVTYSYNPSWDENSHYITFSIRREGENALYVVAAAGGDPKKIADFTGDSNMY